MTTEQQGRHALQAAGPHPAPCAQHCEAVAFGIDLRRLQSENASLRTELVNEAKRTANEKLRADQMTQQHRMQTSLSASTREELAVLRTGYDAARLEIESLQAQLEAIGAGGVEPLRKRECLHQISEPVVAAHVAEVRAKADSYGSVFVRWRSNPTPGMLLYAAPQPAAQALDAARYQFLRDGEWRDTDLEPFIRLQLNKLWDAKIDAAIAAQQGGAKDPERKEPHAFWPNSYAAGSDK